MREIEVIMLSEVSKKKRDRQNDVSPMWNIKIQCKVNTKLNGRIDPHNSLGGVWLEREDCWVWWWEPRKVHTRVSSVVLESCVWKTRINSIIHHRVD